MCYVMTNNNTAGCECKFYLSHSLLNVFFIILVLYVIEEDDKDGC